MNDLSHDSKSGRILLWESGAPGAIGDEPQDKPWYSIHLPEAGKSPTAAVVVCPGGGYSCVTEDHEGVQVAEWLNGHGIAAFVLRYRIAPRYHHPNPLLDAQRMIRTVHAGVSEWNIDPKRIGIWGFSAGGHLAASTGVFISGEDPESKDPIEKASARPDFMILSYPVISMESPYTHEGSSLALTEGDPGLKQSLSLEKAVTDKTPPTFLFHTDADEAVPSENSIHFYLALRKVKVPAEMHVFKDGWHGLGLKTMNGKPHPYTDLLRDWLRDYYIVW